ncbi:MAG: NIPSNAP family protein [Gammaproteobacteria bacterium]|nr:NIPSNAP family protein [Gammaproteobacteria bacterium]MDH5731771.1 NIPSNAP family protein [Gammaproteobacteria bacterium]
MLYELRFYYIAAGKRDEFVRIMDEQIIPFQIQQGMNILGSFIDHEDADCYIWLRSYNDENDKQKLYDKVYGSDTWQKQIRPLFADLLIREKTAVHMLSPTKAMPNIV